MAEINVELREVTKRFGDIVAVDNVSLQIGEGEFFSLLGPSGCGKTTTLRMIAGFELPTEGEIYLKNQEVSDLPPFKRNVNTVFQDYALFPHMTVGQNISFGLETKKMPKAEIKKRVDQALEMVDLPHLEYRRPSQLSGGQQQRVALARAIVNQPAVLLLDEPLSALDLKLRQAMRFELKKLQRQLGITFIFVTHDQEEAMTMSDRIAVMSEGLVLQVGSPTEIYSHPANRFVADFIGETNFLDCTVKHCDNGMAKVVVDEKIELDVGCSFEVLAGQQGTIAIRPEKIDLHADAMPATEEVAVLSGVIVDKVWIGTDTRFTVQLEGGSQVRVRHQNMRLRDPLVDLAYNDKIYLSWQKQAALLLTS